MQPDAPGLAVNRDLSRWRADATGIFQGALMPANVVVPEVGESIVDARVAKWLKQEGDSVSAGEPLVELETDKVDVEVAAPQGGVLKKISHGDGADVKVGEVLGVI